MFVLTTVTRDCKNGDLYSDVLHWRSGSCRSRQLSVPGRRTETDRFLVHA